MGKGRSQTKSRNDGRKPGSSGASIVLVPFVLAGSLLAATGCSDLFHTNTNNAAAPADPLLGSPSVKPLTQIPAPAPAAVSVLPPAPTGTAPLSTAALAANTPRPLDSSHDLRIGGPRGSSGSDAWAGQPPTSPGQAGGAVLQRPEMNVEPASRVEAVAPVSPASLPNTSSAPATIEQAQAQLKARGIVYQQSTFINETGQWEFRCALPSRQNPRTRRSYIGTGPDALSAMRAVLEQIDKDQP